MNQRYIHRKDLARLLELSVRSIVNNETKWMIDGFRADANKRVVRYHRDPVMKQLKKLGLIKEI